MYLSDIKDSEYSINDQNQEDFVIYHLKLTDSALRFLENSARNQQHAALKLSLNGDHGSFVIEQPRRTCQYTFSSQPSAQNEGFQDFISLNKNKVRSYGKFSSRFVVNAKDDSFDMARVRMAQVESEQRNSCSKQLSGLKSSSSVVNKSKEQVKPRNCSSSSFNELSKLFNNSSNNALESSTYNNCIFSKNIREIVISLLALRNHTLAELHEKLKCRNDSSLKSDLNRILKEVSSCGSDGSFLLLPNFFVEVNPNWSGYTPIDKIKVEHLKKKHLSSSESGMDTTASSNNARQKPVEKPVSLGQKIAILDELNAGRATYAQILRKHSVSVAMVEQWQTDEAELRDLFKKQEQSIHPSTTIDDNHNATAKFNANSLCVSTAPRLSSVSSSTMNRTANSSNHSFLGDIVLPNSIRSGAVSGSNSAPVSADGSQQNTSRRIDNTPIPMSKEYPPVVASTHSHKSSSGCSSISSSILLSPQNSHLNVQQQQQGLSSYVSGGANSYEGVYKHSLKPQNRPSLPEMNSTKIQSRTAKPFLNNNELSSTKNFNTNLDSYTTSCQDSRNQPFRNNGKRRTDVIEDHDQINSDPSDSYYKKVPRISIAEHHSPLNEDPVDVATRIARSIIEEERASAVGQDIDLGFGDDFEQTSLGDPWSQNRLDVNKASSHFRPEPTSCNSAPFVTPDHALGDHFIDIDGTKMSSGIETQAQSVVYEESENSMAFDESYQKRLDSQRSQLEQLFPEVHCSRDARGYKKEFDTAYPLYLSLRHKSNQRWFTLKRLYEELQEAMTQNHPKRHSLASQLSMMAREACSETVQDEVMRLGVLDAKLRLLKCRIACFLENQQNNTISNIQTENSNTRKKHKDSHEKPQKSISASSTKISNSHEIVIRKKHKRSSSRKEYIDQSL